MEEKQRKMGERSCFALTCNLLSQYLKENRSLMETKKELFRPPPTTMNLFPGADTTAGGRNETHSGDNSERSNEASNEQLTIFYAGNVMVFDNFPAAKAKELMTMVSRREPYVLAEVKRPSVSPPNSGDPPAVHSPRSFCSELGMPIARRASLHRFLEKRKDRISSSAPYEVNGSPEEATSTKPVCHPWLALG
ncbi:Protein TIFY 10B [Apostasia shenzhenica]|uniref:Protein TIFY n=1 Tax=Apostasia shenzhenica TaxID=1088818 RepID=A0A2I0AEX9_9ASPA|nr:Protein TIFY 10B [Apostasia shenzhenica]